MLNNKACGLRHAQLAIPASFGECFTYEKQILWLKKEIENIETGGESSTLKELERKVNELTIKVNSLQTEVDNINVDELKSQIEELTNSLNEKVNTTTFNESMSNIETTYEKKADADLKFATKSEISNFVTSSDVDNKLTSYETKAHAEQTFAKKTDITNFVTNEQVDTKLSSYALKSEIPDTSGLATKQELTTYETKTNAEQTFLKKTDAAINYVSKASYDTDKVNYYTKSECDEKFALKGEAPGGDGLTKEEADQLYASKTDIENLATKQELTNGLNEKVSTTTFDTTVAGLATKQELTTYETKTNAEQTFLKKTDAAINYVSKVSYDTDKLNYYTKSECNEKFALKGEAPGGGGLTKEEADQLYASKTDIENLATKQELTNGLNEKVSTTTFDTTVAGLATKQELTSYETKANAEQTFAKKTDIANFVTDEQVDNKLSSYETSTHANETFATKTEMNSTNSQIVSLSESKQDKLTFDDTPTEGSQNPVTSGGIYTALQNIGGGGSGVDTTLQTIPTIQYKLSVETNNSYDEPEANGKIAKYVLDQNFGYGYVIFDLQNETISGNTDWKVSSFHGPNDLNVWNYGRDVISAFLINDNNYVQMTERSKTNLPNNEQEVIFTCKYEQTLTNAKLIVMFNFCNLTF